MRIYMSVKSLPVSVIILAHRDDAKLIAAVESVPWAAEIVVVWTSLPPFPESVLHLPNVRCVLSSFSGQNFAKLRNDALHSATAEWVFFLDSDEVVCEGAVNSIEQIIASNVTGARVLRRDTFLGKTLRGGEVRQMRLLRLFRKSAGYFE